MFEALIFVACVVSFFTAFIYSFRSELGVTDVYNALVQISRGNREAYAESMKHPALDQAELRELAQGGLPERFQKRERREDGGERQSV